MTKSIGPGSKQRSSRGFKRLVAIVAVASGATLALSAWSGHGPHGAGPDGRGMMAPPPMMMMGPGALLGLGGPGLFMGPGSERPEHVNRMIDRMLDGLNATDAQRAQIKDIVRVASSDLKAQREKSDEKGLRDRSLQLFTAPTLDAAAIESLRQQVQTQRDQSAQRVTQAMVDIGRVLTPQQRATAGQLARFQADRFEDGMKRMRERAARDGDDVGRGPQGDHGDRRGGPRADAPPAPVAR